MPHACIQPNQEALRGREHRKTDRWTEKGMGGRESGRYKAGLSFSFWRLRLKIRKDPMNICEEKSKQSCFSPNGES